MTLALAGLTLLLTLLVFLFLSKLKREQVQTALQKIRADTWADQYHDVQTKYLADTSRLESVIANARYQIAQLEEEMANCDDPKIIRNRLNRLLAVTTYDRPVPAVPIRSSAGAKIRNPGRSS